MHVIREAIDRYDEKNMSNMMPEIVDHELVNRQREMSASTFCCCCTFIWIIIGLNIWLLVAYVNTSDV